jgi:hypothetical protein
MSRKQESTEAISTARHPADRGWWIPVKPALFLGAAVVLLTAGFFTVDAVLAVRQLMHGVAELQQVTASVGRDPAQWGSADLGPVSAQLRDSRQNIDSGSSRLRSNPLLGGTTLVPGLRDQGQAVIDLAVSAQDGASATQDLLGVALRYQQSRSGSGAPVGRYLGFMGQSAPALGDAQQHLDAALSRLRVDLAHPLLPPLDHQVRGAVRQLQPAQKQVAAAAEASRYLPDAMGDRGPKSYLLLFPNPSELRPAGGFVGSVCVVTVDHGAPSRLEVHGEEYYNGHYKSRFAIPAGLGSQLKYANNSLEIGDAGWDPDFPSSAALSEQMLESASGQKVDGTVAVDPYAVAALLNVTGPVDAPPYGSFTSDNFFARVNQIVNVDSGPSGGKKALPIITQAIVQHLLSSPADRWAQVLSTSQGEAQSRHIQFFFHDQTIALGAARAGYDGSLVTVPDGKDYLMIVDANVGGTKGDGYVKKAMSERVEVRPGSGIRHEIVLRYEYPPGISDPAVPKGADTAYRDYLRVYMPETSTLSGFYEVVDGTSRPGPVQEVSLDHGKRIVGSFFRLEAGHSIEVHVLFQVPADPGQSYRLYVQKQAGVPARPLDLMVSYPGAVRKLQLNGDTDREVWFSW